MSNIDSPIVVLDSGLGGLTVVKALRRMLPWEDLVYFGDTARVPYGTKSGATITSFVKQIIAYLQPFDPKHVVIACNTASALALPGLRGVFPNLSISGVIEPGARAAVEAAGDRPCPLFGVIGTEATVRSRAYEHAISKRRQHSRLIARPAPLLVPMIEEGRPADDPVLQLALSQYLRPMIDQQVDVLVLGCTHYPIYKDLISSMMGKNVAVIDSAERCADDVHRKLRSQQLLRGPRAQLGALKCFVTDDAARFANLASRFLSIYIDSATWVSGEELVAAGSSMPATAEVAAVGS